MILIASDGSEHADAGSRWGWSWRVSWGQPVAFVSVWRSMHRAYGLPYAAMAASEIFEAERAEAERTLQAASAAAEAGGVPSHTFVRRGDPAAEICTLARDRDARMIVVGSHGWGTLGRIAFGSVSAGAASSALPSSGGPNAW